MFTELLFVEVVSIDRNECGSTCSNGCHPNSLGSQLCADFQNACRHWHNGYEGHPILLLWVNLRRTNDALTTKHLVIEWMKTPMAMEDDKMRLRHDDPSESWANCRLMLADIQHFPPIPYSFPFIKHYKHQQNAWMQQKLQQAHSQQRSCLIIPLTVNSKNFSDSFIIKKIVSIDHSLPFHQC